MKLKSFQKVNTAVKTVYSVYKAGSWKTGDFKAVERFTVDYLEKDNEKLRKAVLKRIEYENMGAVVVSVDVVKDHLDLSIEI